ncbi:MAG: 4-hydroxythreonine-4-phosphate dehydrogenase, partial [Pseudomonadota bacterium]
MGEPAGVGGETIVKALSAVAAEIDLTIAADPDWLADVAARTGSDWPLQGCAVHPISLAKPSTPGCPDPA